MTARFSGSFSIIPDRNRLNFSWLIKLRWAQIAGQLATVLGVAGFVAVPLPLMPLIGLVVLGAVSNLVATLWHRSHSDVDEWHLAVLMALDVALLTGLLYLTGGPHNPFSFLYLVQIALAAVVLRAHWTWMLVALSVGAFGGLVLLHRPLEGQEAVRDQGTWVALGVAAGFIVHFLRRVTAALTAQERELAQTRAQAARQERLASLATMAAGAAHELSTPLGTIALVAKELSRALERSGDEALIDDARLIREQVARCRTILDQMSGGPGEHLVEGSELLTVEDLVRESLVGVRAGATVRLDLPANAATATLELPPRTAVQALRSIINNAKDASPPEREVVIAATRAGAKVDIEVIDHGTGMSPSVLARVGEPFFTTKEPGAGMGLGLFLARAVIESAGGTVRIDSQPEQGTCVTIVLPARG
ncbi:ATP-binding protein [Haliangium ochraceum]|uniref:histidine kinase n=1 Tax=Haliangium ochraceum (strain DSM 14365 / JCM 11303 / SMP-2) TaxID=502025 RepID=D0LZP8_HALO1|nr:ATP-binding protein [Haliangium ochraceum]ACY18027.1 integral membrane sensor signal transduction histidine kinase [Haliangium ochraceum DSM 14365]